MANEKRKCETCEEDDAEYRVTLTNLDNEVLDIEYLCQDCAWERFPSSIPIPPMKQQMIEGNNKTQYPPRKDKQ